MLYVYYASGPAMYPGTGKSAQREGGRQRLDGMEWTLGQRGSGSHGMSNHSAVTNISFYLI